MQIGEEEKWYMFASGLIFDTAEFHLYLSFKNVP